MLVTSACEMLRSPRASVAPQDEQTTTIADLATNAAAVGTGKLLSGRSF
jgi:hypothetical protein